MTVGGSTLSSMFGTFLRRWRMQPDSSRPTPGTVPASTGLQTFGLPSFARQHPYISEFAGICRSPTQSRLLDWRRWLS